jgi:hypothetical protein
MIYSCTLGTALNNRGDAVGLDLHTSLPGEGGVGILWTHEGDQLTIRGSDIAYLRDMNDHNQIIGDHEDYDGRYPPNLQSSRGYLWQDAKAIPLSTSTRVVERASDINNLGQIVCSASDGIYIWQDINQNGISDDEDFWNLGDSFGPSRINDRGYMLGGFRTELNRFYLFFDQNENRMVEDEELRLLNRDDNFDHIYSFGFNNRNEVVGQVVKYYYPEPYQLEIVEYAFIIKEGEVIDLNTVIPPLEGVQLYEAVAINDHGWILCNGTIDDVWIYGNPLVKSYLLIPNVSSGVGDHWEMYDFPESSDASS